MDYNKGIVVRSFIWKLLERFSVQGLSLVLTLVLARILEPNDYGMVALIVVFTSLSSVIIDGGLNTALIQKKDADQVDYSTIFFSSLGLSILIYCILFVAAPYISDFYNNVMLTPMIRALSVVIIFEAMNAVQRAYVAKYMLFKKLFYSSLSALILSGAVGLYMALNGFGGWALVSMSICSNIVTTVVMFFTIKWFPSLLFSFSRFKGLFSYGWKIFGINLMVVFYQDVRSLIIGKYYTPASLAFFDRGRTLPQMLVSNISSSLQTVIFPVFSDVQNDVDRVKALVRKAVMLSGFIIFPVLVLLCVVSKPLVLLLLTEKWLPAVPFVWIFSIAYMIFFVQVASMEAVKSMGYSGFSLKFEVIKHVNAISFLLNIYPNNKFLHYGIKEQLSDIFPALILSVIMGSVVYWVQFLQIHALLIISLLVLLGGSLYLLLCHVFRQKSYLYVKTMLQEKWSYHKLK